MSTIERRGRSTVPKFAPPKFPTGLDHDALQEAVGQRLLKVHAFQDRMRECARRVQEALDDLASIAVESQQTSWVDLGDYLRLRGEFDRAVDAFLKSIPPANDKGRPPSDQKIVGSKVRAIRDERGLSRSELVTEIQRLHPRIFASQKAGIKAIQRMEASKPVGPDLLKAVAQALGVEVRDILSHRVSTLAY